MDSRNSITSLRHRHNELYQIAQKEYERLQSDEVWRSKFIGDVELFLEDVEAQARNVISLDDYRWLIDVATKWQIVFSTTLNLPKTVDISPPLSGLLSPRRTSQALSESELDYWVGRNAEYFAFSRIARTGVPSTDEERSSDWRLATVFLASDVLDGKINFAKRLSPSSYYRLEDVWVRDVKKLRAYFRWERRGKHFGYEFSLQDYYDECVEMRRRLVDFGIKALPTEFGEAKRYLEERYLTDGRIDRSKQHTSDLIRRKAERIAGETRRTDELVNWVSAELYVTMFYEHIIPAIVYRDTDEILTVLKAFQFSRAKETSYFVISSFEAALAIYFLDSDIIKELWRESDKKPRPESTVESVVEVHSWPENFHVPAECSKQFRCESGRVVFRGVMTSEQKNALCRNLDNSFIPFLEKLFEQSRLIHEDTTL